MHPRILHFKSSGAMILLKYTAVLINLWSPCCAISVASDRCDRPRSSVALSTRATHQAQHRARPREKARAPHAVQPLWPRHPRRGHWGDTCAPASGGKGRLRAPTPQVGTSAAATFCKFPLFCSLSRKGRPLIPPHRCVLGDCPQPRRPPPTPATTQACWLSLEGFSAPSVTQYGITSSLGGGGQRDSRGRGVRVPPQGCRWCRGATTAPESRCIGSPGARPPMELPRQPYQRLSPNFAAANPGRTCSRRVRPTPPHSFQRQGIYRAQQPRGSSALTRWQHRGEGAARLSLRDNERSLAHRHPAPLTAAVPASFGAGALRDGPIAAGWARRSLVSGGHGPALATTALRARRGGCPFSACPSNLRWAPRRQRRARNCPRGQGWPLSSLARPQPGGRRAAEQPPPPNAPVPWRRPRWGSAPRFALPGWQRGPAGSAPPPQAGQGTVAWRACSGRCWPLSTSAAPSPFSTSLSDEPRPPASRTDTLAGRAPHFVCSADSPSPLLHPIIINLRDKEPHPHPFRTQGSTPWGQAERQPTC